MNKVWQGSPNPRSLNLLWLCNIQPSTDLNSSYSTSQPRRSVPGVFGNLQNQNLDVIKRMLFSALQPNESEALRVQAVKAVGAFILLHDKEPAIQKHFADLLAPLMQVMLRFTVLFIVRFTELWKVQIIVFVLEYTGYDTESYKSLVLYCNRALSQLLN